jgi:excisionase family DNA binding protein
MSSRTYKDEPLTRDEADELVTLIHRLLNAGAIPSKYLTVSETCERLGISRAKLYHLFGSGELRRNNVGKSVRVLEADVERFMSRQGQR